MDPLSITASIIAILQVTTKVGECLRDAKDASTDCDHFTNEISNLSTLLVTLLSHMNESPQESWRVEVKNLGGKDGVIYQYRVALEQLQEKATIGHGVRKLTKILLWKYVRKDADSILSRIEKLKSLVQIALQMDHIKLSQANHALLSAIDSSNKAIHTNVTFLRSNQDRSKHLLIMDWLSSANFPAQQLDHIQRRQEDTGLWFLKAPEFTQWIQGSNKTLFCPGIPGAGKTMMAAIVVDHLQNTVQTPETGVAYLYCSYKRQEQQTASNLLAAMLKQLVQDNFAIAKPAHDLYDAHEVQKTRPSAQEIFHTLLAVLASYTRTYIVIDALDECSDKETDRTKLLDLCFALQQEEGLYLLATSRHISNIVEKFSSMPQLEVRAEPADVKLYIQGQVGRLPKCVQRDPYLQECIQGKIAEAVDGMFLLARLHLDSLLDKRTKAKVLQTLENLTKGFKALGKAYDEAIIRIDSQLPEDSTLAKNVLSWISYARRPLTVGELCHALAVEPGDEELNTDNILDIDDILSVCAGLVTIDEESQIIRLVHYTTQEYLQTIMETWNEEAPYNIAATCTTYLCFEPFQNGPLDSSSDLATRIKEYPLLCYSVNHWVDHVANVQEQIVELSMRLLQHKELVATFEQIQSANECAEHGYDSDSQFFRKHRTGLHLAASLGLLHLSTELLFRARVASDFVLHNCKDDEGDTPLHLAAQNGHIAVVQMLLALDDLDVDHKNLRLQTPLVKAVGAGHSDVIKVLLDTGKVDVNARVMYDDTALIRAAEEGHEQVVKLLLASNAVVDARDYEDSTALIHAASAGHEQVVKLLLASNAEVDARDNQDSTALIYAASAGHEQVVKLLLASNAEVDARDNEDSTALIYAASEGHEQVVQLLLASKAEIDAKNDRNDTALILAAEEGHKEVVKLLRHTGKVDIGTKGLKNCTAVLRAAVAGHPEVLGLLLDTREVNDDAKSQEDRTALINAIPKGHVEVLRLLLNTGEVDVNARNGHGSTMLMSAISRDDTEVMRVLIDTGKVDINARSKAGWTALMFAVTMRNIELLRLLLATGKVDVNAKDKYGRTALLVAIMQEDDAAVRILLSNEAIDVEQNAAMKRALRRATDKGRTDIVNLVRSHIANHKATNCRDTATQDTSEAEHTSPPQPLDTLIDISTFSTKSETSELLHAYS